VINTQNTKNNNQFNLGNYDVKNHDFTKVGNYFYNKIGDTGMAIVGLAMLTFSLSNLFA